MAMDFMSVSPRGGKNQDDLMRRQQAAPQHGPLAQKEKGVGEQIGDMYKQKAMNSVVDKSTKMAMDASKPYTQGITNAINPMGSAGAGAVAGQATTNAALANAGMTGGAELALAGQSMAAPLATTAGTGLATTAGAGAGMAALGTAVPYIGAGLLAGKALGLFNEGGYVGPLSPEYKMGGGPLGMGVLGMYHDMMKKNMR